MQLKDLENLYANEKLIFVSGSGPSLHFVDPEMIKDYPIIAVNSSVAKFKDVTKLHFLSDDVGAASWGYYAHLLPTLDCMKFLYKKKLEKHTKNLKNVIFFNHTWWFSPLHRKYNLQGLVLHKDSDKPIIGARTSLASAIHFAYIMAGPQTRIVLLGSDCSYIGSYRYYWQFPNETKQRRITGEPVFAQANRGTYHGFAVDSHSMDFLKYWKAFAEQNKDTPDLHIINASGGILDVFERMPLEKVVEVYG